MNLIRLVADGEWWRYANESRSVDCRWRVVEVMLTKFHFRKNL